MVGLCDEIREIGKMELAGMNFLHISYLLSSPLVLLLECRITCNYKNALGKKFYCKNICLKTLQVKAKSHQKYVK